MRSDIQRFYARWARVYDLFATVPGVDSSRERAAAALALSPGETVVEMGCGTGANVPHLRERVGPAGRVLGLDLTREMLRRAGTHPERRGSGVGYVQGDARRPPVREADAVLATFVLGIFAEPAAAVDRWCDLVGSGGRVALLNFQPSDRPLAAPCNLFLEGVLRLSAPGGRLSRARRIDAFERRIGAGRAALVDRTRDRRFETFAGGYLGLLSGRVT